jgi:hypothetical protein
MKKIEVKIEITGIEGWDRDWNNEGDVAIEIAQLELDIIYNLSEHCGITANNLTVNAELIND